MIQLTAPFRSLLAAAALLAAWLVAAPLSRGAENIPPPPPNHFNDFAGVVPPAAAQQLDRELADFERQTSNQIVVAVYRKMQSDSSIDDYSVRVYQAWKIGQKGRDNGALLLVFTEDRKMRIATGYGLEGALPDATCKRILDTELMPRFRQGDFAGGLAAGVHAMLAATRGEYRGTGSTQREAMASGSGSRDSGGGIAQFFITGIIILILVLTRRRRGTVYGRGGRSIVSTPWWSGGPGGWGGGGWGGGSGGGSWGGGGGGGFSGGGGSTGGGGASGSW